MAIADYVVVRKEISLPNGGSFSVRGLGVTECGSLVRLHLDEMEEVRAIVQAGFSTTAGISDRAAASVGLELVQRVPVVVSTVIALAADELESASMVMTLPLYTQFAALKAVAELTFQDVAGLKLMLTTVLNAVRVALPRAEPSSNETKGPPS